MSFEYTVDKEDKKRKLDDTQKSAVVSSVVSKFDDWDNIRTHQIEAYRALKREIYLEDRREEKPTWKAQNRMNKIYSLFHTRQSFLWENLYADQSKMFDVEGTDPKSEETAKYQKASILDSFDKMKISQQLDKSIEWFDSVGELCLFTSWKRKTKQIRRNLSFKEMIGRGKILSLIKGEAATGIFEKVIYDGAYVEAINPINIVFDPDINPEIKEQWDKGGKIIKTWKTYDQIASNKIYQLSKADLKAIKDMIAGKKDTDEDKDAADKVDDVIDGNKIEVLEYWGDFTFEGNTLRNYVITVIGREFLVKFVENPFLMNPIINVSTSRHPDSKRGIPCLWSVYDLVKVQEEYINEARDVQQLNKNPTRFAPVGFFKDKELAVAPGKIIEFTPNQEDPSSVSALTVPLIDATTMIQYLDKVISEVSGVFPNMQGQEKAGDTTATEMKITVAGQTTRLSKDLDTIKQNAIIPMVENIAELNANELNGKMDTIFMMDKGDRVTAEITDDVRQGDYSYTYSDSTALAVKKMQFKEAMQLFTVAAGDPVLGAQLNKKQILVTGLDMIGITNTDQFFLEDGQAQLLAMITQDPQKAQLIMQIAQGVAIQNQTPQLPQPVQQGVMEDLNGSVAA